MNYTSKVIATSLIVEIIEEKLDVSKATSLKTLVKRASLRGYEQIVIDLSGVNEVDSFGYMALLSAHKLAQPHSRLILCGANRQITQGLSITRLNKILILKKDIKDAVPQSANTGAAFKTQTGILRNSLIGGV